MTAATVAVLVLAPTANAAQTRAEYVAQVDPICRASGPPILKAFNQFIKAAVKKGLGNGDFDGKALMEPLARFTARIARAYGNATARIAGVSPAPGDEATVSSWLQARESARRNMMRAHAALKRGNQKRYDRISGRAGFGKANYIVSSFGFENCSPPGSEIVAF